MAINYYVFKASNEFKETKILTDKDIEKNDFILGTKKGGFWKIDLTSYKMFHFAREEMLRRYSALIYGFKSKDEAKMYISVERLKYLFKIKNMIEAKQRPFDASIIGEYNKTEKWVMDRKNKFPQFLYKKEEKEYFYPEEFLI